MTVLVKKNIPSGTILLNRPDKRNALSRQLLTDLAQALGDLHQERKVRAVILTGAGTSFCAGMDLHELMADESLPVTEQQQQWGELFDDYRELVMQMLQLPKPIIASVNGPAVAGGAGLVLASDIVVATATA